MNKLEDALTKIQNFLKKQKVPYMLIGGIGQIDQIVYKLCALAADEIKIEKENVSGKKDANCL